MPRVVQRGKLTVTRDTELCVTGVTAAAIEATYRARTPRSAALHEEACRMMPGGVTRSVTFHAPYPTYVADGCGCRVRDVDGNEYLDLLGNFGSMIHGHAHPAIVAAVREQIGRGTDFGSPTELHIALARALKDRVRSIDQVRFASSGSEAVLYAIRAARALTGRSKILKMEGSYHGGYDAVSVSVDPGIAGPDWPEGYVASRGLSPHIGSETLVAPFNDLSTTAEIIRQNWDELAAVIVEPVMVRGMIPASREFLTGVRAVTQECSALLIVDEVVTLRLASGGAQQLFDVTPDLTAFGKIIGGGLPVGAFGGRADIMAGFDPRLAGGVHHSGTFAGNAAVAAAGLVALALLTPGEIARINVLGDRLRGALRATLDDAGVAGQVTGLGSLVALHLTEQPVNSYRDTLRCNRNAMRPLHLALLNRGLFARHGGSFFLSTPMTDAEVDETARVVGAALSEVMA